MTLLRRERVRFISIGRVFEYLIGALLFYFYRKSCLWTAFFDRSCPLGVATIDVTHILIYSFTENSVFNSSHENVIDFLSLLILRMYHIRKEKKVKQHILAVDQTPHRTQKLQPQLKFCDAVDRHILVWLSLTVSLSFDTKNN